MPVNAEDIQRGSGPSSFAFAPQQPFQDQSTQTGASGQTGLSGGNVQGGSVDPRLAGQAGLSGAVGGFIDSLIKPYAEQEAQKKFLQGVTDQMYAGATKELYHSDSPLTKIFGKTTYQQGAQFYAVQDRVAKAQGAWQQRMPDLEKMNPTQVSAAFADHLKSTLTDDAGANAQITEEMVKASPIMLQSVAKANYAYQQRTASAYQTSSWDQNAANLQTSMAQFAAAGNDDQVGAEAARRQYISNITPFYGQDDASLHKNLVGHIMKAAQDGNGYAATAAIKAGGLDQLAETDRIKVDAAVEKSGRLAITNAAQSPEIMAMINKLEFTKKQANPDTQEVVRQAQAINAKLKQVTGFNNDFFDASTIESDVGGVWGNVKSQVDKMEAHAFSLQLEQVHHDNEIKTIQYTTQQKAASAMTAAMAPNPAAAASLMGVGGEELGNAQALLLQKGDFKSLDTGFRSGASSAIVKNAFTNTLATAIANGYSPGFEAMHSQYLAMDHQNPAMAKEYFGQHYPAMLAYDNLMGQKGMDKNQAFQRAFGNDHQYSPTGDEVADSSVKIAKALASDQPGMFSFGTALTGSSQRAIVAAISRESAIDTKAGGSAVSFDGRWRASLARQKANGQIETYGKYAWAGQKPGTQTVAQAMDVTPEEAEKIVPQVIEQKLRQAGGSTDNDTDFRRYTTPAGDFLQVTPSDEHGTPQNTKAVLINMKEFASFALDARKGKIASVAPDFAADAAAKQGLNPYRVVANESGWDRTVRINKEVKAASPMGGKLWPKGKQLIITGNEPWAK